MTEPWVFPNPRTELIDLLAGMTPSPVTVGDLPTTFRPESPTHLQVGWDGTVTVKRMLAQATIRICAWSNDPVVAEAAALTAHARLLAHDGTGLIASILPGVGPLPTRDANHTNAELAWFTVIATVRPSRLT
jgi:hypothetical protein